MANRRPVTAFDKDNSCQAVKSALVEVKFWVAFRLGPFQLEKEVPLGCVYARTIRPATPASKAMAGLPLLLAAPVKVATGGAL